jgi:hypothetical protein
MVRPCVARGVGSICWLAVLHQCIRPLIGACCAPGHHGNQRARVLISCQTSSGPFGSPGFACAVKTGPPSRLILSQTSAGNRGCGAMSSCLPCQCSSFVRAIKGRSFVPACSSCRAPRAGAVQTGRPWRPPAGLGLDGSEHGATLMRVGTLSRVPSRIRMRAPC